MSDPVEDVLQREHAWLLGLRLIERAELAWLVTLPLAIVLWAGLLLLYAAWHAVLLAAASHAMLSAISLALSPRGRLHIWCGLVLLSMLHFSVYAALEYAHLAAIATAYAVLACFALGWCAWRVSRLAKQWRGIAGYTKRDDFRWLIMQAPLPVRYKTMHALRRAAPKPPR